MFMHHNYKRLAGLHYFTNLMELRIVNQGIEKIEGLDNLIHLRKLWLNENKISVITGLKNMSELRELYLYVVSHSSIMSLTPDTHTCTTDMVIRL